MKIQGLSLQRLALLLSDFLAKNNIEVVLTGGACVTIYASSRYISYDLDFVLLSPASRKKVKSLMEKIGFRQDGRHFKHDDTPFLVEFLPPPLSVGEEPPRQIGEMRKGDKVLRLLSPTDCVKDRLAAYYHWNDRQSLMQTSLVCRYNDIDMKEVERWSIKEGMEDKFSKIRGELINSKD